MQGGKRQSRSLETLLRESVAWSACAEREPRSFYAPLFRQIRFPAVINEITDWDPVVIRDICHFQVFLHLPSESDICLGVFAWPETQRMQGVC